MNDYSDLIYLMGAMIIYSMLSMQTSRMFQLNNRVQIKAEIEYNAVSIAQNEIDQLRWVKNEEDFDNYVDDFPTEKFLAVGNDSLVYTVNINSSNINIPGSNITNKNVTVTVTNEYLNNINGENSDDHFVKLQLIKSFVD